MALTDAKLRALKEKPAPFKIADAESLYVQVAPGGSRMRRSDRRSQILLVASCLAFEARQFIPIDDAVRVKVEVIAFRGDLKQK